MTFFVCAFKLADFLADYYALYKAVFVYLGLDTDIFLTDYQQTLNLTIFTTGTSLTYDLKPRESRCFESNRSMD